jgi:hypothetical protein
LVLSHNMVTKPDIPGLRLAIVHPSLNSTPYYVVKKYSDSGVGVLRYSVLHLTVSCGRFGKIYI